MAGQNWGGAPIHDAAREAATIRDATSHPPL